MPSEERVVTRRPWWLRVLRGLGWVLILVVLVIVLALASLRTDWGRAKVLGVLVEQAAPYIDGQLTIGRLEGPLLSGASLQDVSVTRDGTRVLHVDRVDARFDVLSFLSSAIHIDDIRLVSPDLTAIETETGWYVDGLQLPDTDPDAPESQTQFSIGSVVVEDGHADVRQMARRYDLQDLDAEVGFAMDEDLRIEVRRLSAVDAVAQLPIRSLTTRVVIDDSGTTLTELHATTPGSDVRGQLVWTSASEMRAELQSKRFALEEFAPYAPAVEGLTLHPTFDLALNGPLNALRVTGPVSDPEAGDFEVDLVSDLSGTFAARGHATVTNVNAAHLRPEPMETTKLTGEVDFDVRAGDDEAIVGTFAADLSEAVYGLYTVSQVKADGTLTPEGGRANYRAVAYGTPTTGVATWALESERITAEGHVTNANMAALPEFMELPALESAFTGRYRVELNGDQWALTATLERSTVEGATLGDDTSVALSADGKAMTYAVSGPLQNFDPIRVLAKVSDEPMEWPVESVRLSGPVTIRGNGPSDAPMEHTVTFSGELDADVDGAVLRNADLSGDLRAKRLTLTMSGDVSGQWERVLNMAEMGEAQATGRVRLSMDIPDVSAEVGPLYGNGALQLELKASELADVRVDTMQVDASLANGLVSVKQFEVVGPIGRATAAGQVNLDDAGPAQSLNFDVLLADLSQVPEAWGLEASGQVAAKGVLSGTMAEPVLRGTWSGSTLKTASVSVLNAEGTFDVQVPDMDPARRAGTVSANAAYVETSGQTLTSVVAKATLEGERTRVAVDVTHELAGLHLSGLVSPNEDGATDIVADAVRLKMADAEWQLAAGETPRVRLTETGMTVSSLTLVSGDQRLRIDGGLPFEPGTPAADARLVVEATQVAMAPFVTVLLGSPRVEGALNGTATVTGALSDPAVDGTFEIRDGRADDVPFSALTATIRMASQLATVDASLDAGPRGTARVSGTVPVDAEATTVDLTITAALSDVGVVAPALPYVTEASGAAKADLTVKGSLKAPDINGMLTATDIRFRVPETGVSYRNMNGTLNVRNSVLEVQEFRVEDQDGKPLTMTGRLDVLNQQKSAEVDVRIRANDFTLLANQFGQVGVNIDLTAVGTMVAPQIIGQITVVRGRFEVDRLLQEFAAASGYVDQAVVTGKTAPASPEPPNVYSGAAMSIDVRLPDNVVVRGRGLQTEEGPIGLGDINLTLGGTLQIRKAPGEQPALVGDVSAVRGTYEFQGRRFQIERGSRLRFRGDDYTNPALDIIATREVSGVDVTVRIGGTAAEPSLTLSSDPSLDQGDILALIVFNRPINELGEGQKVSLASRAGTLAATALTGPLADSVAQALNLDVFEIRPEDAGSNGPVVVVGRQVSDRLYVGFRHDFGAGGRNQVTLEYRLNEFLRLLTTLSQGADPATLRGQADSAGIDLIYVIRR